MFCKVKSFTFSWLRPKSLVCSDKWFWICSISAFSFWHCVSYCLQAFWDYAKVSLRDVYCSISYLVLSSFVKKWEFSAFKSLSYCLSKLDSFWESSSSLSSLVTLLSALVNSCSIYFECFCKDERLLSCKFCFLWRSWFSYVNWSSLKFIKIQILKCKTIQKSEKAHLWENLPQLWDLILHIEDQRNIT